MAYVFAPVTISPGTLQSVPVGSPQLVYFAFDNPSPYYVQLRDGQAVSASVFEPDEQIPPWSTKALRFPLQSGYLTYYVPTDLPPAPNPQGVEGQFGFTASNSPATVLPNTYPAVVSSGLLDRLFNRNSSAGTVVFEISEATDVYPRMLIDIDGNISHGEGDIAPNPLLTSDTDYHEALWKCMRFKSQLSVPTGTPDNPLTAWWGYQSIQNGGSGLFLVSTTAANSSSSADAFIPSSWVAGDGSGANAFMCDYIGAANPFTQLDLVLSQGAAGGGGRVWQYWNGVSWVSLPGLSGVAASTFTNNGSMTWSMPGDWISKALQQSDVLKGTAPPPDQIIRYWIRTYQTVSNSVVPGITQMRPPVTTLTLNPVPLWEGYAADGTTRIALLDRSGNLTISGSLQAPTMNNVDTWNAPTLLNGWHNQGAGVNESAGYRKDQFGRVWTKGLIAGGTVTAGTAVFVLPAGYRPPGPENLYVNALGFGAIVQYQIQPNGNVLIQQGGSATYMSMRFWFETF